MKKSFLILTILFLLAATPTLANQGHGKSNEHANEHANNNKVQDLEVSPTDVTPTDITPSVTVTPSPKACDPDEEYENHGKYVSCVARTHPGGKEVSEAARSNVGKKHHDDDEITPSPSISPSVSPSISPTEEPTPTATQTATTNGVNTALTEQIQALIDKLKELLDSLKNLATL